MIAYAVRSKGPTCAERPKSLETRWVWLVPSLFIAFGLFGPQPFAQISIYIGFIAGLLLTVVSGGSTTSKNELAALRSRIEGLEHKVTHLEREFRLASEKG